MFCTGRIQMGMMTRVPDNFFFNSNLFANIWWSKTWARNQNSLLLDIAIRIPLGVLVNKQVRVSYNNIEISHMCLIKVERV